MERSGLGRILIVDDEQSVRDVLTEYFVEQGYSVQAAVDGQEALALVQASVPDLVLLDVRMPGLDGVETLRRLRAIAKDLAIIMVTANEDVGLARDTLKLGALDYIAKPFDFVYLERAIMAGLARTGPGEPPALAPASADPWRDLARAVFQAVRGMGSVARASTGARMEDAALTAARESAAGRRDGAAAALDTIEFLLGLAADLRDFGGAEQGTVRAAVERARQALRGER
jgi:two-component system response regulator (stage 0 sporulation protein F)